jgi:hypothetical protein
VSNCPKGVAAAHGGTQAFSAQSGHALRRQAATTFLEKAGPMLFAGGLGLTTVAGTGRVAYARTGTTSWGRNYRTASVVASVGRFPLLGEGSAQESRRVAVWDYRRFMPKTTGLLPLVRAIRDWHMDTYYFVGGKKGIR